MSAPAVLVLTGSARGLRRAPSVAAWVAQAGRETSPAPFEVVDVADLGLALDDEPALPALGHYASEATRAWSARVAACAAVVFVTPQYNWGYPAPLKNAIDHLYTEWRGKPGAIVTYGGHGGGKCAAQLRQVLEGGLKMRLAPTMPELTLPADSIPADDGRVDPAVAFADRRETVTEALRQLAALREDAPA